MSTTKTSRPNVLWIFGDQHSANALSYTGDPNIVTPNLDTLAEYGVYFPNAVTGFPLCCPFRGSLLTSRYPHECVPGHNYQMPPEQKTVAHAFKENGYKTAYFGKWHVDGGAWNVHKMEVARETMQFIPRERRGGFDTWIGYENNNSPHNTWVHGHDSGGEEVDFYRLPGFETDALTDMLIGYITDLCEKNGNADEKGPFFAALSVQPPHNPYAAPESFMKKYNPSTLKMRPNVPDVDWVQERARRNLAGAYAMIDNLDWNVGRVRDALRKLAIDTNTYIIFFSDHGDMHGSHGMFHKTSPYAESLSMPFIIGGGLDVQGESVGYMPDAPVNHVDIAPTTLGLCGIEKPSWMDGTDYSHYRTRKRWKKQDQPVSEPDTAYIQSVIPTRHPDSIDLPWRGVVTRDGWKYVCLENTPWLMFNRNNDPYEQVNLAHNTKFKEKRKELNDRLRRWVKETGDSFGIPEL